MTTPAGTLAELDAETVDRVAAAIYEADILCNSKLPWTDRPDRERRFWRNMAVAAIEALRDEGRG